MSCISRLRWMVVSEDNEKVMAFDNDCNMVFVEYHRGVDIVQFRQLRHARKYARRVNGIVRRIPQNSKVSDCNKLPWYEDEMLR